MLRRVLMCCLALLTGTAWAQEAAGPGGEAFIEIEVPGEPVDPSAGPLAPDEAGAEPGAQDSLPPIEKMPELTRFVQAEYPAEVYKRGIEGAVLLELLVSDSGMVDSAAIVTGLHPRLDSSALQAARQFVFTPAIAGGVPVPVLLQYEYRFALQEVVAKTEKYVNFSGQLVEQGTRSPIANAMVVVSFPDTTADTSLAVPFGMYLQKIGTFAGQYLEERNLVTLSDSTGRFQFLSLPACSIAVTVPVAGYEPYVTGEQISSGEALEATYRLRRVSYSEYEIVVYGKREEKEVARRQLTLQEVKKIPGFSGDAVKVVQALPGVARPTFGSFQMVIRGSQANSSKFFLDGVEIPILFHYGLKSTYNSDALQTVDFYPGGWGSRYGGAIGGIIEITGRRAKTDRWHGYVDGNFLDGAMLIEGPVSKKVSVLASVRRSFIGDLINLAAQNSPMALVMTTAPYYWDYTLRTDISLSDRQHAYFTLFGVKDGMKLVVSDIRGGNAAIDEAKNSARVEVLFNMGIAGWQWKLSERLSNDFKYSLTKVKSSTAAFGTFKSSTGYWQHYLRDQFALTLSKRLQLNAGADVQVAPVDFYLKAPDAKGSITTIDKQGWIFGTIGGYVNAEWKPTEKLTLLPGLRYEFYPELDYNGAMLPEFWDYRFDNTTRFSGEPALRLTTRYALTSRHTLKASAGSYSQSPQPEGQWIIERLGDPRMPATHASQYVVGHEWRITDLINSDVQVYYNRQWDVPRYSSSAEFIRDQKPVRANGERRMRGFELLLRHDQGQRFFGWLAYSLSRSEYYDRDEHRWALISKDQTHNLIAVGSWKLPMNWEAGFKLQYTTGDPTTPLIGSYYDENRQSFQAEYGPSNSARLDPTVQLDIRFDKKFVFRQWILSAYVDFFNIGYFLYKSPQMVTTDRAEPYDYAALRANQRAAYQYSIPSIGIRGEF